RRWASPAAAPSRPKLSAVPTRCWPASAASVAAASPPTADRRWSSRKPPSPSSRSTSTCRPSARSPSPAHAVPASAPSSCRRGLHWSSAGASSRRRPSAPAFRSLAWCRPMPEPLHLFILAGETSGDRIGADLVRRLRLQSELRLSGVGGTELEAQGLAPLFPMHELSVMGWADVLPRLPRLLWRARQVARAIIRDRPDVVVLVDAQ